MDLINWFCQIEEHYTELLLFLKDSFRPKLAIIWQEIEKVDC